jgi:hypothetical protein
MISGFGEHEASKIEAARTAKTAFILKHPAFEQHFDYASRNMDEDAVHFGKQKGGGKGEYQNQNRNSRNGRFSAGMFWGQGPEGAYGNRPAERYPYRHDDTRPGKLRQGGGNDAV